MRRVSKSRAAFNKEANEWRADFKSSVGRCEYCLIKALGSSLDADEIARGCCRKISLMAPYAILVVRPEAYDLEAFWLLTRRRWPDQEDVDREAEALLQERLTNGIGIPLQYGSPTARQEVQEE